jgi:hypothetical protein
LIDIEKKKIERDLKKNQSPARSHNVLVKHEIHRQPKGTPLELPDLDFALCGDFGDFDGHWRDAVLISHPNSSKSA